MRSFTSAFSLPLAVIGVMIAFTGSAFAVELVSAPEPMSALVFGAGLVGVAVIARRKR